MVGGRRDETRSSKRLGGIGEGEKEERGRGGRGGGRGREVEDGVGRVVHYMGREWFLHFTLVPPT